MEDPIELQNLFYGTMSGAAVVLMGAFYAAFFALSRVHNSWPFAVASMISFVLLMVAAWVLASSLQLAGFWSIVIAVMLIGYFLAPRAIWKLCIGTHAGTASDSHLRSTQ